MPVYLSPEWHLAARENAKGLPSRPGASVRLQYLVTGSPRGDLKHYLVVEDGQVVDEAEGSLPEADVTLTTTWSDSVRVQRGEIETIVLFMQGKAKATGNIGKLMNILPVTSSAEYRALQQTIRDQTTFDC